MNPPRPADPEGAEGGAREGECCADFLCRPSLSCFSLSAFFVLREDFSEAFLELFQWVQSAKPTQQQIVEKLGDDGTDQYMVRARKANQNEQASSH